jgi:OOP family OmpA-OmpF porin
MLRRVAVVSCLLGGLACATPSVAPLGAGPVRPGPGERVAVTHNYLIVDSSESVTRTFPAEKAHVQSFVAAMPDGSYQAGGVSFGGYERQHEPLAVFDRSKSTANAAALEHLGEGTPIDRVLAEVAKDLQGKSGEAAIVIWSDGQPTDPIGRHLEEQTVLNAASALVSGYQGPVCIHTVHMSDDPAGAEFLRKLSATSTSNCGSSRSSSSVMNVAALQNFEREVYFGALPAVAAAPRDSDGDGVMDDQDQCPGTPLGVTVDGRGCWVIPHLHFAFDSAKIDPQFYDELNEVAAVMKANPSAAGYIDGHTDSVGTDAYNQSLSQRRAQAVRDYLVQAGVPASSLESRGFGEAKPAYSNETADGRSSNRRVELSRRD